jgi:D-alanyl-D-alanine endopeptidase (penicillin-binding protein 7)
VERSIALAALIRVCLACAMSLPAMALAEAHGNSARRVPGSTLKTPISASDCKIPGTESVQSFAWRRSWERSLAHSAGGADFPLVGNMLEAGTPTVGARISSLVSPASLLAGSDDRVLISNVPELALALPDGVDLPEASFPASRVLGMATLPWEQPDELSAFQQRLLRLRSWAAVVVDQQAGRLIYAKNPDAVKPIASITKVMTAMVVLDSGAPLNEVLTVDRLDVDTLKGSSSRLKVGTRLTRGEMLKLALMSSENRAAAALARSHPQGRQAFVDAMNMKARALGMEGTQFLDPTGLNPRNRSTAYDLALMVNAGYQYSMIREFTTSSAHSVALTGARFQRTLAFHNSNRLVGNQRWDIGLSKTGYINEAGSCLVLQATIAAKPVIIVLLDSLGTFTRFADANRIKRWIEGVGTGPARRHRL